MVFSRSAGVVLGILLGASVAWGQKGYPPAMPGSTEHVYREVDGVKLKLWRDAPDGHDVQKPRPAIVFFFGGGWRAGSPRQFMMHSRYLASRGMLAFCADYRVASRHGVKAKDCVEDAKAAMRWLRRHAKKLGVDPQKIVASGGSAGGHLAACLGVLPEEIDQAVSFRPNAMVLFNPAVVLANGGEFKFDPDKAASLAERMGVKAETLSPWHHVRANLPPAILFHGTADTAVPYVTARMFTDRMTAAGNRCELVGFEGEPHGFFNHGRKGNKAFATTVEEMDAFLASLGYLKGDASVQAFWKTQAEPR